MNQTLNKKVSELEREIAGLKNKLDSSEYQEVDKYLLQLNPDKPFNLIQQTRDYIVCLKNLNDKIQERLKLALINEQSLKGDIRTLMNYSQLMRANIINPQNPRQILERQGREYRVLMNLYGRKQSDGEKQEVKKIKYTDTIGDMEAYNLKLHQRLQRCIDFDNVKLLKEDIEFLKHQNQILTKQNLIAQQRSQNYLHLKSLSQTQQSFIKSLEQQILHKQATIKQLLKENQRLQQKIFKHEDGDKTATQEIKKIKNNFLEYFQNKKQNFVACQTNQNLLVNFVRRI